ncbi:MAG: preprotein translocase subunit SecA [Clostridia bacterium]|nr:preprotein translocase subunit SecA [Clostridia bacterium]
MIEFIKKIFDDSKKTLKKLNLVVDQINQLEPQIKTLSDSDLQGKTIEFREKLAGGADLNDLLPEAFAVVREAGLRVLGMRHFDVQLIGGLILHNGGIAEMKTGEGKTLVATLPVYLNALTGKGVHVVTVNDYLATRDSQWMGQLYRWLGLSVGLVVHNLNWNQRREAYASDITYGTNNEYGFDYLRDNMASRVDQLVQRELNYAIVDEVDSILIDEARTPLIISGQASKATDLYDKFAKLIPQLKFETDYTVDEKAKAAMLTEEGVARMEKMLGIENLYDDANIELTHHMTQALKAHALMKRDRDYVVKDDQVIIVDEFTGRLMFGRRYSDGLHQAIEAKEGVMVEKESQTLATITFQNYFRMYDKLAGMTGTAKTEEDEFSNIYHLSVSEVPTHKPMLRQDLSDLIYKNEKAKFNAVIEEIVQRHETGQPILVGTISIEKSEILSGMLKRRGIKHQVLNAKFHEKEAEIIAQAGQWGAVTIATNMAGRGTDILLGGNWEFLARMEREKAQAEAEANGTEVDEAALESKLQTYLTRAKEEYQRVAAVGGLHIIGTERHESRRIDNQLRGRSGRQGDPGSSQFYSSLEDDLMRLFGSDNIKGIMERLGLGEDVPIEHKLINKSLESAQKKVENRNFSIRKNVLQYDDVMNQQRELIYKQRKQVLRGENIQDIIKPMFEAVAQKYVETYCPQGVHPEEWDLEGLLKKTADLIPNPNLTEDSLAGLNQEEMEDLLQQSFEQAYQLREAELGSEEMRELERLLLLKMVDEKWMEHLDIMDQLREGIGLRAYGQRDPLIEYSFESHDIFQNMIEAIQEDTIKYLFRVRVVKPSEAPRHMNENRGNNAAAPAPKKPIRRENKIGRNDPCPCGSGKKYKHCCGK